MSWLRAAITEGRVLEWRSRGYARWLHGLAKTRRV
jgi:hypothetical protein